MKIGRALALSSWLLWLGLSPAKAADSAPETTGQLTLRKSIGEREYRGKSVEGEERRVAPGDSLWRILIQEKGLSSARFSQYIVVIRGLNPQLPVNGALRVGDTLFIPLRPDEVASLPKIAPGAAPATVARVGKGTTQDYQIKAGDHLYGVLRQRLGITDERQLATYYALVKDLNPQKTNWDLLVEGETIRLPVLGGGAEKPSSVAAGKPAAPAKPIAQIEAPKSAVAVQMPAVPPLQAAAPAQLPAKENLALLSRIMESLNNQVDRSGEQVIASSDGKIRLEKSAFPTVYNPQLNQRVILDAGDKIPPAMRSKLNDRDNMTSVLTLSQSESLQEAVKQLLSRLGYQSLPADQPVMLQQGGVGFEAKGDWALLGPEQSNRRQEIYVISIGSESGNVPEYLRKELASSGVHLKRISTGPEPAKVVPVSAAPQALRPQAKEWPRDKKDLVDALLDAYGISFGVSEVLPVELKQGLKLDVQCDRLFDSLQGGRTALIFHSIEPELKQALQEKLNVQAVELAPPSSSREIIARVLRAIGQPASYEEHRFEAGQGSKPEQLTVSAWGFLLSKPALLVTDRKIPQGYERFFFEKGFNIVYFQ